MRPGTLPANAGWPLKPTTSSKRSATAGRSTRTNWPGNAEAWVMRSNRARNDKGWVEGFEIKGVSEELRLRYSKRRAEVEAAIDKFVTERGRKPNPAEISQMASETRSAKLREISTPEVRQFQRSQLSSQELSDLESLKQEALNRAERFPRTHGIELASTDAGSRSSLRATFSPEGPRDPG